MATHDAWLAEDRGVYWTARCACGWSGTPFCVNRWQATDEKAAHLDAASGNPRVDPAGCDHEGPLPCSRCCGCDECAAIRAEDAEGVRL